MPTAHRRRVGSTSSGPPPRPDRSGLVVEVDEPTPARTGTLPGVPRTDVYGNTTINGQSYYVMSPGEDLVDVTFHCRVRAALGASLDNFRILGWPVPSPSSTTNYAMLDLTPVGGTPDRFTFKNGDLTPDPANVGPANTGIRGGGGTGWYIYGSNLPDMAMVYGGRLKMYQSLAERPFTTWPAVDPTRTDGQSSHSDCFFQLEGGSFEGYGCKVSAIWYDPATGLPYYDPASPEWGGRYLPNTNGAGFSCFLSSGNQTGAGDRPVDLIFEGGWAEGAKIPFYIVNATKAPTGRVSIARTRVRKGLLGVPNATSPRYHLIKPGAGFVVDTTGTVACSDDRTALPDGTSTWTPSGSLVISNAG